jgi:hypothetical protein
MCNSRKARAIGSTRARRALEVRARRADLGEGEIKANCMGPPGGRPKTVAGWGFGFAATATPRVRTRGVTDDLLRPGHDDPETRRTNTSSPFEGRRKAPMSCKGSRLLGHARRGAISKFGCELDAQRSRTTQRRLPTQDERPRDGTDRIRWPSDALLGCVSKGADDNVTPQMQNRLYIGARIRVGKRISREFTDGREAIEPRASNFGCRRRWVKAPLTPAH